MVPENRKEAIPPFAPFSMLQHVVARRTTVPARLGAIVTPLGHLFRVVKLQQVVLNAHDIFQICGTISGPQPDTLGMLNDPEFMRGLSSSFERSDQRVLSPFQISVVTQTFAKAGIFAEAKEVAVPEQDAISPESLMNMLQAMLINKMRDERKIKWILDTMGGLLNEFSPLHMTGTCRLLSQLQCSDFHFLGKLGKRVVEMKDDFSHQELATVFASMCFSKAPRYVLVDLCNVVEQRVEDLAFDDVEMVLHGLTLAGPQYNATLKVLVTHALEKVENLTVEVLCRFLQAFQILQYAEPAHKEIFADALVEKNMDLNERQATMALQALHSMTLLSAGIFETMTNRLLTFSRTLDVRNVVVVMDICSSVPYKTEDLMQALMDRAADCVVVMNAGIVGDMLELLGTYPPAKEHRLMLALGKLASRRVDLLGPMPLAKSVKGLAAMGYPDAEFYTNAATTFLRWGIKDFTVMEALLNGLCVSGGHGVADPRIVRLLASHMTPMCAQMSVQEVERANRYMCRLMCDDEWVYKALADRLKVFVKDVTPDVPEELQQLLQRGAAHDAARAAKQEERAASRGHRGGHRGGDGGGGSGF